MMNAVALCAAYFYEDELRMMNMGKKQQNIGKRTKAFALRIIRLYSGLPKQQGV